MKCTASAPRFTMTCHGPTPARYLSLEEQIRQNPAIVAKLDDETVLMNAPLGSLFFIDYSSGSSGTVERAGDPANERPEGMPRTFYFGRLLSREKIGPTLRFRLLCMLTRGAPGTAVPRTFSTRTGTIHDIRFMELPSHDREVAEAA